MPLMPTPPMPTKVNMFDFDVSSLDRSTAPRPGQRQTQFAFAAKLGPGSTYLPFSWRQLSAIRRLPALPRRSNLRRAACAISRQRSRVIGQPVGRFDFGVQFTLRPQPRSASVSQITALPVWWSSTACGYGTSTLAPPHRRQPRPQSVQPARQITRSPARYDRWPCVVDKAAAVSIV